MQRPSPSALAHDLAEYFEYRARVLNDYVEPRLMDAERAKAEFERLNAELNPTCPLPMNKQKGEKKAHAFLTSNMLGNWGDADMADYYVNRYNINNALPLGGRKTTEYIVRHESEK